MDRQVRMRSARAGSASKPLVAALGVLATVIGLVQANAHRLTGAPLGTLCSKGNDCQSGECLVGGLFGRCTKACDADRDCEPTSRCVNVADGHYCVERGAGGASCRNGLECESGVCLGPPVGPGMPAVEGECAAPCGSAQHRRCPAHHYCAEVGTMLGVGLGQRKLTQPACLNRRSAGAVCQADDQCESDECAPVVVADGDAAVPQFFQTFKMCR